MTLKGHSGIAGSRFSSSNLIEYLREFESVCKTVLAHESGDPGVQLTKKTEGRKSRDTVPLKIYTEFYIMITIVSKNMQYDFW
jgi:hypothetical protein